MKKLFFLTILFGGILNSNSQITNIFPDDGHVGIGTDNPSEKLGVNGNIKVNNLNSSHSYISFGKQYFDMILVDNRTDKHYGGGMVFRVHNDDHTGSYIDAITIKETGEVGIGTIAPSEKLVVSGNIKSNKLYWGNSGAVLNNDQGASIELRGTGVPFIDFSNDATTDYDMRMILSNDNLLQIDGGNVSIGTNDNAEYQLAVAGDQGIIAEKVTVKLYDNDNGWPDYVFNNNYNLPTLEEVEKHIEEKGHLQNIPSAEEIVEKGGFELGQMNTKLLQKIEELTLYTIQQQKEIEKEKEKNTNLEERIKKIEALLLR